MGLVTRVCDGDGRKHLATVMGGNVPEACGVGQSKTVSKQWLEAPYPLIRGLPLA